MVRAVKFAAVASVIVVALTLSPVMTAYAVGPVFLDVTGYGYNVIPAPDGGANVIGCGPTTGTMILEYYSRHGAPGLIGTPLVDARAMTAYMNTDAGGFGPSQDFHFGLEQFAYDQGYYFNATIHKEPTTHVPGPFWEGIYGAPGAPGSGADLVLDATFWNTTTWDINDGDFLNFVKTEIDAGRPLSMSVASQGVGGGADHWMVCAGYDLDAGLWYGYNTWDNTLHAYSPTSAFMDTDLGTAGIQVPTMSIAFVRTFQLVGPVNGGPVAAAEPSTLFLLGSGLLGVVALRRKPRD
jgi:hypothetical protein